MRARRVVGVLFVWLFVSVAPARAGYHLWFGQGGSPLEELTVGPGEAFSVQVLVSDDNPASVVTFTSVDAKLGNSSGALLPIGGVTGLGSFAGFTTLSQGGTLVSAFSPITVSQVGYSPVASLQLMAPSVLGDYVLTAAQHPTNVGRDLETWYWQTGGVTVSDLTVHVPEPGTLATLCLGGVALVRRRVGRVVARGGGSRGHSHRRGGAGRGAEEGAA